MGGKGGSVIMNVCGRRRVKQGKKKKKRKTELKSRRRYNTRIIKKRG